MRYERLKDIMDLAVRLHGTPRRMTISRRYNCLTRRS